jgi:hypothetical protein
MPTPNVLARIHYYEVESEGRDFYSSSKKDDYLNYIDKGIKSDKAVRDYIDYAGNEEKSSGLFWENGMMSGADKKELRKKLRSTKSCIWDLVVSFEEDYGKRNLKTAEDAMEMLKANLPKLFKGMNLDPENVIWAAGMHTNTQHRHCHVFFFEKEPTFYDRKTKGRKYRRGKVPIKAVNGFKMSIEKYFLGTMESAKRAREIALEETRSSVEENGNNGDSRLKSVLLELYRKIPYEGKTAYLSDNMRAVRPLVDEAVDIIQGSPEFQSKLKPHLEEMKERDRQIRDICFKQKLDPEPYLYAPKFETDLHRRMANEIIGILVRKRGEEAELLRSSSHPKQAQRIMMRSAISALEEALYYREKAIEAEERSYREWKARMDEWERWRKQSEKDSEM